MKRFQINNTSWGYVVEAYWPDKDGFERWQPLRNFGDRQGDAIVFRDIELITDDWDGIDIDFEIAQDSFDGKYYVKVIETIHYEQM